MMRGLPGSGKSTLARLGYLVNDIILLTIHRKLKGPTGAIFSTDDYYMVDGV